MIGVNPLAVGVSVVAAFLVSGAWYGVLGGQLAQLSPAYAEPSPMGPVTIGVELLRTLVVAVVFAGLLAALGAPGPGPALLLAVLLWLAFPAVLLAGSVLHENVPPLLAGIHAGDWLLKLAVLAVIVGRWG